MLNFQQKCHLREAGETFFKCQEKLKLSYQTFLQFAARFLFILPVLEPAGVQKRLFLKKTNQYNSEFCRFRMTWDEITKSCNLNCVSIFDFPKCSFRSQESLNRLLQNLLT